MFDQVGVDVPPNVAKPGFLNRHEPIHISVIIHGTVRWSYSGVEVADKEERIAHASGGKLDESAEKRSHSGPRTDRCMDNAEAESVRRNRDLQPEAGIVEYGNAGWPGVDSCL